MLLVHQQCTVCVLPQAANAAHVVPAAANVVYMV